MGEKEDFATVMALPGHKDIPILKRYSHTQEEAKRNAIAKLEIQRINHTMYQVLTKRINNITDFVYI